MFHKLYSAVAVSALAFSSMASAERITLLDATIKDKTINNAKVIVQKNGQSSEVYQSNCSGLIQSDT